MINKVFIIQYTDIDRDYIDYDCFVGDKFFLTKQSAEHELTSNGYTPPTGSWPYYKEGDEYSHEAIIMELTWGGVDCD